MTELSSRIAALSPKRRALLAQRLRAEGGAAAAPAIPRRRVAGPVRLSYAQERLWFLDRWQPGSPAYNLLDVAEMLGRLEVPALAGALLAVLRRHEVLRSVVLESAGEPFQTVSPLPPEPPPVIDLSALPEPVRRRVSREIAAAEGNLPFDLARGPLLRARLLRLAAEEHWLLWITHHMVADLWSFGVMLRELTLFYRAGRTGEPARLPELAIQYADFAVWQRGWLAGEVLERQLAYWRRQLAGAPVVLGLPVDRPRPAVQGSTGALLPFTLPAAVASALKALGKESGATPFMILLAAFDVLLYRYTGQESLLLGSPVAGRTRPELEALVGLFVNTVVLRADFAPALSFASLLAQVRETTLAAFEHQDLPFERLVEDLQPARDPSRLPLVQVLFAFQNPVAGRIELPDLTLAPLAFETTTAKCDLSLFLTDGGDLAGVFEYHRDLFDRTTAARLAASFARLVEGIVADPATPVEDLPLLGTAERAQLVEEWAGEATAYPRESTIHALFAAQAAASPDAVALLAGGEHLSYGELAARAGGIARVLAALGVGPEIVVALALPRSPALVAALIGVLAAGGAYLPLDLSSPGERLAVLLEEGRAEVLLATAETAARLPPGERRTVLLGPDGRLSPQPLPPPRAATRGAQAGADNLAYVMFTSGSTGRPKGVAAVHRGVVRLVLGTDYARFGRREVFLQLAPASFDAATFEIWGALLNGSLLVLMPPEVPTLADLGRALSRHGVTTLWLTAGLFHQMVEENLPGLAPLSQLLAGGDALSPAHVARVAASLKALRLINGYGPTEGTTFTCCWTVTGERPDAPVPIGRPIANTRAHVLDHCGQPQPVGVPGELAAGGDGLARGYLHRPDLTAERFRPDPTGGSGERLYYTGDLARRLPAGEIEFLGRIDRQVKIRGFRIEPGEIEAALARHPQVAQAAVLLAADRSGDKRLVACVAGRPGPAPAPADLREHLRRHLPEAMVPATLVVLDSLPLTANGKVDRGALLAALPEVQAPSAGRAPRTATEERLAGIWAELLSLERVGCDDNFFDLGGHSLLATRLAARLYALCGVEIPLRRLFELPTIRQLAAAVDAAGPAAGDAGAALRRLPEDAAAPLSFAQQRLWFVDQLDPGSPSYNISLFVRFEGPLDLAALWAALGEIVRRHETLRSRFPVVRGVPVLDVSGEIPGGGPLVDHSALPAASAAAERGRLELAEQGHRFRLERGPLLRALLVRQGASDHEALLTLHHIVVDGWSLAILARELEALYTAAVSRRPAPLPELPVQYRDYAAWQRSALAGPAAERLLAYWTGQLAALPPPLALPYDRPRQESPGFRGAALPIALAPEVVRSALALAHAEGATLFIVLLAAWKVLLAAVSGQRDLLVGSPVAGRTRTELEPLIGIFMNTLVLRTRLDGDPTFREAVRRVRATALAAYDHQDLPFEQVVDAVLPAREAGRPPLYQVWFVLQNQEAPRLALPQLRAAALPLAPAFTKFDLALNLGEGPAGVDGQLEYAVDLFDEGTARQLAGAFAPLVSRALADPERRVSELGAEVQAALQAARAARRQQFEQSSRSTLMNTRRQRTPVWQEMEEKR